MHVRRPARLISGGQSGVDRAALDFAIAQAIPYGGWCPLGGWAEDRSDPPGLLADYRFLRETPSADPAERTRWNVRDSDATLILAPPTRAGSPGTAEAAAVAVELGRPLLRLEVEWPHASEAGEEGAMLGLPQARAEYERLAATLPQNYVLNVAGPRQSEAPGAYSGAMRALELLLG